MPGLFFVHFGKHHSTDEMKPVDQVLKGMEDCKRAVQGARFRSPERGQWMSLWPFQRCEKSATLSPENRRGCLLFNLCNSPSILSDIHSAAKSVWQGLGQRAHLQ